MKDRDRILGIFWDANAPNPLRAAIVLLYIHAVLELLAGEFAVIPIMRATLIAASVIAAVGIVARRRWAYALAIGVSAAHVSWFVAIWIGAGRIGSGVMDLFFAVIQLALLLHTDSKEHQRLSFT